MNQDKTFNVWMRAKGLTVYVAPPDYYDQDEGVRIFIAKREGGRTKEIGKLEMVPFNSDVQGSNSPTLTLSKENAQLMMNQMWECGVRPSQAKGSVGQLDAVKYHLEDMRKLVFKS